MQEIDKTNNTASQSVPAPLYQPPASVTQAKTSTDNTQVDIVDGIVTAAWNDCFYVEAADRSSGIRVYQAANSQSIGNGVDVLGAVGTDSDGERCIMATGVYPDSTGSVAPLGLSNRNLGGGPMLDPNTGAGQQGVAGGAGLNNIGLLVSTWGKVQHADSGFFYVDDGSALKDGSGYIGVKVYSSATVSEGQYVKVTGISSCEISSSGLIRVVRTSASADVFVMN